VTAVNNPGQPGVGHQWAYLPDVASTMVQLLARRDSLAAFATFHMAGHWDPDGTRLVDSIRRVVAQRSGTLPRVSAFPWWLVTLASPFVATFREMREMRYLWREPVRLHNARLVVVLGQEPHTPLDQAVEATLLGLGCLTARDGAAAALDKGPISFNLIVK
jgi:nucleoside-diphosphate-sugar epimerase